MLYRRYELPLHDRRSMQSHGYHNRTTLKIIIAYDSTARRPNWRQRSKAQCGRPAFEQGGRAVVASAERRGRCGVDCCGPPRRRTGFRRCHRGKWRLPGSVDRPPDQRSIMAPGALAARVRAPHRRPIKGDAGKWPFITSKRAILFNFIRQLSSISSPSIAPRAPRLL